jgi:hypothetical protein
MWKALLVLVFIIHSGLTVISYQKHGYFGFFPPFTHINTLQIFMDLGIALTLVHYFIYLDLKKKDRSIIWLIPLMIGSLLFGSFAPLLYCLFSNNAHESLDS